MSPASRCSDLTVPAADGRPLAATLFEPEAGEVAAVVLVAPAMAVRRHLYAPLAGYLAAGGLTTLSFDYRGVGDSRQGPLRQSRAQMHDWGELDLEGALGWLAERHPGLPLLVLGHSAGGQLLGLAESIDRVEGVLAVGAQSGHWRYWPGLARVGMWLLWHLAAPGLVSLCGYLPMRRITGGENVPPGVGREWARWGRHPDYVLSYARAAGRRGYDRYDRPLLACGFTDDAMAPPAAVRRLPLFYPNADSELRILSPADLGVERVGHFGAFREAVRDSFWRQARQWLTAVAAARSGARAPADNGGDAG